MKHVLEMYRFVKLVDDVAEELEKENPAQIQLSGYKGWHPTTVAIKQRYMKKYGVTLSRANAICTDTIREEYVEGLTQTHHGKEIDTLCLQKKGREFIDSYLFIPWGLWGIIWEKHGKLISFLAGGSLIALLNFILNRL